MFTLCNLIRGQVERSLPSKGLEIYAASQARQWHSRFYRLYFDYWKIRISGLRHYYHPSLCSEWFNYFPFWDCTSVPRFLGQLMVILVSVSLLLFIWIRLCKSMNLVYINGQQADYVIHVQNYLLLKCSLWPLVFTPETFSFYTSPSLLSFSLLYTIVVLQTEDVVIRIEIRILSVLSWISHQESPIIFSLIGKLPATFFSYFTTEFSTIIT